MYGKSKDERITLRTTDDVKGKIEALANQVNENKWSFSYSSTIRKCDSKSGLIHELLAENITLDEIREKLEEVENDEG